jgi:eukaryotic-like serine/threonine-protein kinase
MELRQEGQVLGGKYRLIRQLGQGGMGSVWLAHHLVLNASVALKFIDAERLDVESLQRFLGEARMAAALRSPHVVQILDYGVEDDTPHIAMELLEGETLAERLARVGRLEPPDAARVIQQVSRALGRAHDAGIVHRDLKPENVFIVANDDDEVVKVLDFGIAKGNRATLGSSAAVATSTGALLGTLYYMSPEQVDGGKSLDHRSDIWSLGVLSFKLLLGHLPFAGDSVGRVVLAICSRPLPVPSSVGQVPPGFDGWFARACAREPGDRFGSVREAARDLLALCEGNRPAAAPASDRDAPSGEALGEGAVGPIATTTQRATYAEPKSSRRAPRVGRRALALAVATLLAALLVLSVVRLQRNAMDASAPLPHAAASVALERPAPEAARVASPAVSASPAEVSAPHVAAQLPAASGAVAPALSAAPTEGAAARAAEPAPPPGLPAAPAPREAAKGAGAARAASPGKLETGRLALTPATGSSPPGGATVVPAPAASAGERPAPARPASARPLAKPTLERIPAVPPADIDLGI